MRDIVEGFSTFLKGVNDTFFMEYYCAEPYGFRCAVLDFEADTTGLGHAWYMYRMFGIGNTLHTNLLKCFNERRLKLV